MCLFCRYGIGVGVVSGVGEEVIAGGVGTGSGSGGGGPATYRRGGYGQESNYTAQDLADLDVNSASEAELKAKIKAALAEDDGGGDETPEPDQPDAPAPDAPSDEEEPDKTPPTDK